MKIKNYVAFHIESEGRVFTKQEIVSVKKAINGYYIVTLQGNYISKYLLTTDDFELAKEFTR